MGSFLFIFWAKKQTLCILLLLQGNQAYFFCFKYTELHWNGFWEGMDTLTFGKRPLFSFQKSPVSLSVFWRRSWSASVSLLDFTWRWSCRDDVIDHMKICPKRHHSILWLKRHFWKIVFKAHEEMKNEPVQGFNWKRHDEILELN